VKPTDKPQATYLCGEWSILQYSDGLIVHNREGKTYIIRSTTDRIVSIPHYVKEYMAKHGLLDTWRDEKLKQIALRLTALRTQHERFVTSKNGKR